MSYFLKQIAYCINREKKPVCSLFPELVIKETYYIYVSCSVVLRISIKLLLEHQNDVKAPKMHIKGCEAPSNCISRGLSAHRSTHPVLWGKKVFCFSYYSFPLAILMGPCLDVCSQTQLSVYIPTIPPCNHTTTSQLFGKYQPELSVSRFRRAAWGQNWEHTCSTQKEGLMGYICDLLPCQHSFHMLSGIDERLGR